MPVFVGRVPSEFRAAFHALECGYLLKYQKWEFRCSQSARKLPARKLSAISCQLKAKHDTDFTDATDYTDPNGRPRKKHFLHSRVSALEVLRVLEESVRSVYGFRFSPVILFWHSYRFDHKPFRCLRYVRCLRHARSFSPKPETRNPKPESRKPAAS
jgi:hypothetical protein